MASRPLALLRRIVRGFPGTRETVSFGHPTFQAGKKTFAVLEPYRGIDTICLKATKEDQALLTMDPRFFVAPYVGKHGWTSMSVEDGVDEAELRELVASSYRLVATKAMLAELARGRPRPRKAK